MGTEVWLHVKGHGVGVDKDMFGYRGVRITTTEGSTCTVTVHRRVPARIIGRLTGGGLFAESQKLGFEEDWLESGILGSDSIVTAEFEGRRYCFWGDSNLAHQPLGIFNVSGAIILEDESIINDSLTKPPTPKLKYFSREDKHGRLRPRGVAEVPNAKCAQTLKYVDELNVSVLVNDIPGLSAVYSKRFATILKTPLASSHDTLTTTTPNKTKDFSSVVDVDFFKEETPMSLGLSVELANQYTRTLDLLQCWINQSKVLVLNDTNQIKETIASIATSSIATSSIESVRIPASQSHDHVNPVVQQLPVVHQHRALEMCEPFRVLTQSEITTSVLTQSEITTSIHTLQKRIKANLYGNPTWIWGLISLADRDGKHHLVCSSMKVKAGGTTTKPYQLDLLEWNREISSFQSILTVWNESDGERPVVPDLWFLTAMGRDLWFLTCGS